MKGRRLRLERLEAAAAEKAGLKVRAAVDALSEADAAALTGEEGRWGADPVATSEAEAAALRWADRWASLPFAASPWPRPPEGAPEALARMADRTEDAHSRASLRLLSELARVELEARGG